MYDAVAAKARQGYVVGATVFAYNNVPVLGPSRKRSHVERHINPEQPEVVRRIFGLFANGYGYSRITKLLNSAGAAAPKLKGKRPAGWSASTVKVISTAASISAR